jgi:hypothetical protein
VPAACQLRLFASWEHVSARKWPRRRLKPLGGYVEVFTLTMIAVLLICDGKVGFLCKVV